VKALIVDDERLARSELRRLLANHPAIEVAGEARDAFEARKLLDEVDVDLLFLDIQMPEQDGFEFLASLDDVPAVIFTTAYDEYALRAFEVSALDYLLKPISADRLAAALAKLPKREPERTKAAVETAKPAGDQIFIKDGERCWFLSLSEVTLFESEGNYVRLLFGPNRPLVLRSLNQIEERLDPTVFFRASRKHIINLRRIQSITPWINGGFQVKLKDGPEIEMSRRQAQKFKDKMGI
jgi:two-component system LytT family response regulator